MSFLRQVRFEIKNILKVRFILVMALLVLAGALAIPSLGYLASRRTEKRQQEIMRYAVSDSVMIGRPGMIREYGDSLTIDGVTIYSDNPFFWDLQSLEDEKQMISSEKGFFQSAAARDLLLDLLDEESSYYLLFAKKITSYEDYRMELAYFGLDSLHEQFFFEHLDSSLESLAEVGGWRKGMDLEYIQRHFLDADKKEREAALEQARANLAALQQIVERDDFPAYIALMIQLNKEDIARLEDSIQILEKNIVENPQQEEYLNQEIIQQKRQIENTKNNLIPLLEYRLSHNIIPGLNIWQNNAINEIQYSRSQLAYLEILSEEEWQKNKPGTGFYFMSDEKQTYPEYVASVTRQQNNLNKKIIVAQKSLDSNRPDMVFVPNGARNRSVSFLDYSAAVLLFAVLLGGWLIASEYQQGTIRLLMIRPRTRTSILLAKFTAAVVVWLVLALASHLSNLILNGLFYGFSDFGFPNYTVNSQISFFVYFPPRFLACLLPVLFSFTAAFMISVIMKNTAVSISLPIVFYVASFITMSIVIFTGKLGWLTYTPVPFMQMAAFFTAYSNIQSYLAAGGQISLGFGIMLLLLASLVFTATATLVFNKRDIAN